MSPDARALDVNAILAKIREDAPAGIDIEYAPTTDKIKSLRKTVAAKVQALEDEARGKAVRPSRLTSLEFGIAEWNAVQTLAAEALTTQSKDLRLGVSLLEALVFTTRLAGVATGLAIVRRLLDEYWDGLFPLLETSEREPAAQREKILEWLNEKLPILIRKIPLTDAPAILTLIHVESASGEGARARTMEGWPTASAIQTAIDTLPAERRNRLKSDVAQCRTELDALSTVCDARFGNGRVSFSKLATVIDQCQEVVAPEEPAQGGDEPVERVDDPVGLSTDNGDRVGTQALEMVRQGRLDGLRVAQQHIAAANSGRERFLRQLQLAELCLEAGMTALAYPLLDELSHIAEDRNLKQWEDPSVLERVWSPLSKLGAALKGIRADAEGRAEKAAEVLRELRPASAAATPREDES